MTGRSAYVAAVDLGATSGRVIVGRVGPGELELHQVARFPNDPVRTPDGLHWNLLELYRQILAGLTRADREFSGEVQSLGIDSWAVDYALLRDGRVLGMPYHYRDERTARGVASVHQRVGAPDLFRRNGLQHLPFNTLFQLAAEDWMLDVADTMLLVPDLLTHWLTGAVVAERTNASTTGLLDVRTREWDTRLAGDLDLPVGLLPPLVDPGTRVGELSGDPRSVIGRPIAVTAVGSHDTASAVVALPTTERDVAFVSCGTWGLVGLELDHPILSDDARLQGFTNEGGVDDRYRFLHNVMGLWVLTETIRTWERTPGGVASLPELLQEAAAVPGPHPVFDVDDPCFLPPGDMPTRISEWFARRGVEAPSSRAAIVRSIVESLAEAFARTAHEASRLASRSISAIHVVGGGSQNALLCQATADRAGLPVLAGPVEATAIGNILVQARATGVVSGGLENLRSLVTRTFPTTRYEPRSNR